MVYVAGLAGSCFFFLARAEPKYVAALEEEEESTCRCASWIACLQAGLKAWPDKALATLGIASTLACPLTPAAANAHHHHQPSSPAWGLPCSCVTSPQVAAAAFDLLFAFDEVISLGHKENVTVAQVGAGGGGVGFALVRVAGRRVHWDQLAWPQGKRGVGAGAQWRKGWVCQLWAAGVMRTCTACALFCAGDAAALQWVPDAVSTRCFCTS